MPFVYISPTTTAPSPCWVFVRRMLWSVIYLFLPHCVEMFNFVVSFKLKINLDVMDKRKQRKEYSFQIMDIFLKEILELFFFNKDNLVILDLLK